MTSLTDTPLILQWEVRLTSLLGLKGLMVTIKDFHPVKREVTRTNWAMKTSWTDSSILQPGKHKQEPFTCVRMCFSVFSLHCSPFRWATAERRSQAFITVPGISVNIFRQPFSISAVNRSRRVLSSGADSFSSFFSSFASSSSRFNSLLAGASLLDWRREEMLVNHFFFF